MNRTCLILALLLVAVLPAYSVSVGEEILSGHVVIDDFIQKPYERGCALCLFIPESYDGKKPYSLFLTLSGYEGLFSLCVWENLRNGDYAFKAVSYNSGMMIAVLQPMDWHERSAQKTLELTEHLLSEFNIDKRKVYREGFSGGGETGSLMTAYVKLIEIWRKGFSTEQIHAFGVLDIHP